ncbi:hypothetical protein BGZ76_001685 [Entomortierella beljakovae]|nr:hypothetical protein BGZ76_001685 [Entomortierella beljakovae]
MPNSNIGFPQTGVLVSKFYTDALAERDPNKRRRMFADARQSNICSYQVYVLAAEVEEKWGADLVRLKALLSKGVIVFRNPHGQASSCPTVSKNEWWSEAAASEKRKFPMTAKALRQTVSEHLKG